MKKRISHTPGPWAWDEMDGRIYVTPEDRPCHYVADINSKESDPEGDYPTQKQREANARLIAAAPVLLENAKRVIVNWERGDLAAAVELSEAQS